MAQLLWVPRYWDDIESDMSAFHRVDDIRTMSSAQFFKRAERLVAYDGAMQKRLLIEHRQQQEQGTAATAPARQQRYAATPNPARAVPDSPSQPVTEAAAKSDPVLSKIFDFD